MKSKHNPFAGSLLLPVLSAMLASVASVSGATINYVGNVEGAEVTDWRTDTTVKSLDPDGDNFYGTHGALHWQVAGVNEYSQGSTMPGWAWVGGPIGQFTGPDYADIDHATLYPANADAGIGYGPTAPYTFELTGTAATYLGKTVRIGVMQDVLGSSEWAADTSKALQVIQIVGGTGDSEVIQVRSGAAGDGVPEMYFFDLTNVTAGDRFQIVGLKDIGGSTTQNAYLGPISFDVIPGPPFSRWVLNGSGNWNTPANWAPGVPNAPSATALLDDNGGIITGPVTATLDVPVTLGTLQFDHTSAYTVAGANALTFNNAGNGAVLNVLSGNHVITAPVTMAESLTASVGSGASLDLSGTLSSSGSQLVKNGSGNLLLSGNISGYTAVTTINEGTVTLTRAGNYTLTNEFTGLGRLAFTGGGRVTLSPTVFNDHGGTNISNGGTLVVDSVDDLGLGGVAFDNGTLEVTGDLTAATSGWSVAAGGGTLNVASGFTLQGGGLTGTGAMNKTGAGTWRILPGAGASIGLFTVSAGTLDFDRNDTFGIHIESSQDLVIEAGALVTNGVLTNSGYNALRNVTLNGGELRVTGTAGPPTGGAFGSYGLKQTVTVGGSAPSSITDPGNLTLASINLGLGNGSDTPTTFAVADVTGNAAVDLSVSAVLQSLNANTGLCKTGAGTMRLTRANTYLGNTSVEAGTLILDQAFLADAADVELSTGATLQLDFAGADTIDELLINGVPQASGTWGSLSSSAAHKTSQITGNGILHVGSLDAYTSWAYSFTDPILSDIAFTADPDFDGLTNAVEYALGLDPRFSSGSPGVITNNGKTITFTKGAEAKYDNKVTYEIETSISLGVAPTPWEVNVTHVTENSDTISITFPTPGPAKDFARLKVTLADTKPNIYPKLSGPWTTARQIADDQWHADMCLIQDKLERWHCIGINQPISSLFHAVGNPLDSRYEYLPRIASNDPDCTDMWAPYAIWKDENTAYLYYAHISNVAYDIRLMVSHDPDLETWEPYSGPELQGNTVFSEPGNRDPCIFYDETEKCYLMYYASTGPTKVRKSTDLLKWSEPIIVIANMPEPYKVGESPFVMKKDGWYYLFVSGFDYGRVSVYASRNPYYFGHPTRDRLYEISGHAPEIVSIGGNDFMVCAAVNSRIGGAPGECDLPSVYIQQLQWVSWEEAQAASLQVNP